MLVLTRRLHEKVHIGDDIVVQITDVDRGRVRLAITAPRETLILRGELKDAGLTDRPGKASSLALPTEPHPPGVDLAAVVADPPGGG